MLDALVLAGGVPGVEDPLRSYTGDIPKSMVDVAGKPMIQWVLDALAGSPAVGKIVISGRVATVPELKNILGEIGKAV